MTTVKIKGAAGAQQTPSAELIAEATRPVTMQDPRGRVITLRRPGVLAQYRLIEALGPTASNEVYVRMCMPLLYVGSIDELEITPMTLKAEVEALIQRLGEDGVEAVMAGVQKHYGKSDPKADKERLKN